MVLKLALVLLAVSSTANACSSGGNKPPEPVDNILLIGGDRDQGNAFSTVQALNVRNGILASMLFGKTMQQARFGLNAGVSGNGNDVIVSGGVINTGAVVANSEILRRGQNQFQKGPAMSAPRFEAAGASVGNHFYTCGGTSALSTGTQNSCERFAFEGERWESVAAMPKAVTQAAAASDGKGSLWVIGGKDDANNQLSDVNQYIVATNQWKALQPMAETRVNAATLFIHDFNSRAVIVACGGEQNGAAKATCELYDTIEDRWTAFPSLLTPRSAHGMAFIENTLLAFGGAKVDTVERFDVGANKWVETAVKLGETRSGFATVVYRQ